ncbi:MAG TPA: PQQ-binding-like beta-propeller repeat protein, partial [Methylomirabilota bacterium]|nr:PQQ-binding-like beta-propeller repeat protein [Methylomirabilota bacterium]
MPLKWSAQENVAFRLELPSAGAATPIVIGDRIFVTAVEGDSVWLWSVDRRKGAVSWKKPLGPAAGHAHRKHNMGSPSPVTDGKSVFTLTGTGVLKGFDMAGKERWARDLQKEYGPFGLNWGYASSPLLDAGTLYVPVLHGMNTDAPSYLLGIEASNGRTRFRVERPTDARAESPDAYITPAVARKGGAKEIVLTGGDVVTGHDPGTGAELWRASGLNPGREGNYRIVASPVVVGDLVVAPTRIKPMLALRAFGRGDVSGKVLWSFDQGPDVPTPTTDGTLLYVVTDRGLLTCLDLATGHTVYGPQRLAVGTYSASPLLADGRLYATNEDGLTSVVKAGPKF